MASATSTFGIVSGPNPVGIGADLTYDAQNPNVPAAFKGVIDNVRIYDKALSQEELNNTRRKADNNTLLWLDFNSTTDKTYAQDTYYSFGGDWQDIPEGNPNNKNFCANGLVSADRTVQPELEQVKYIYQDIAIDDAGILDGKVKITNKYLFTNANEFEASWELIEDGKAIQNGVFSSGDVDVRPVQDSAEEVKTYGEKVVTVPFTKPELKAGAEYFVNISFKLKEDASWAKKGHEVAHGQIAVPFDVPEVTALKTEDLGGLGLEDRQDSAVITGKDFTVTFDKTAGTIKDFTYKGKKLLESGPQPDFWRAPTDSDLGFYSGARYDTWRYAGEDKTVSSVTVKKINNGMVEISADSVLPTTTKSSYSQKFTIYGTGDIKVTSKLTPGEGLPEIPVVGNSLTLPKEFSNVTWYGKGPDENYIDRQSGYEIGVYKKDVDDFFIDYIKPQETGNRTETRWVSMTNSDGTGLLAKTDVPMEFSALYYTAEELTNVMHSYMLGSKDRITLRLNQRQMGLGGDNSWGAKPLPAYLNTSDKVYEYSFTLKPVSTADVDASMREYKTVLPSSTDSTTEQPGGEDKPDVKPELKKGDSVLYKNVYYTVADPAKKTAIATKGKNKNIASLVIQKQVTIKGVKCKVVQIGDKAFSGYKKLAKATIGKNVKTIGKQAFKGSIKLKSITLEKGSALNTVKSGAFKNTSAKITVKAPGMKAKQRNVLLKKMKKAGMGKKAV